jgi:YihY family inner membrane protein
MVGSIFLDFREATSRVMTVVENYVPAIAEAPGSRTQVLATIEGVIASRKRAGAIAAAGILWGAMGFVHALVRGVNRAWGTQEYPWWRLPFQNLFVVGIVGSALLIGVFAPVILDGVESFLFHQRFLPAAKTLSPAFKLARLLIPTLVLFYAFSMLYKFAPRRKTAFSEVWLAALTVAVGLQCIQSLFVLYAKSFNYFNKFYGTLGGIVAFLMWIYLSGSLIILGGCLCAANAEVNGKIHPSDQPAD